MTISTRNEVLVSCENTPLMELLEHLEKDHAPDLDYCLENLGIVGTRLEEPRPRELTSVGDFEGAPVGTIVDTDAGPHMKIWKDKWLWIANKFGDNRANIDYIESDRDMSVDYTGTVLWTPEEL